MSLTLNQVIVPVRDVEEAKTFYAQLGLHLIVDDPPHYARFECPDGHATLSLELDESPADGGPELFFECEDLDLEVERLTSLGVIFDSPPEDQPWLWRQARLRDPSGNRLCLYHAGANRRFPPWRLDGRTD